MANTNKKEIKCTFAYLTINNLNLDRNFRFKVIRSSQSLVQTASVSINRNYFDAHKTTVQKGDKIYISIQNNKEEKVLIFQGVVNDVSMTPAEISLTAFYKVVDNEVFNETYKDTKLEKVLSMIAPKIKYEAQDKEYSQLIARGTKLESLSRFLNQKSFFVDLKMNLVVRDNPKNGTTYIVDECLFRAKSDEIIIFPIPQLDIQDVVEYQGQKFIVEGIVYHYLSKSMMILDVVPYKGIEKSEFIIEEIPEDQRSKPIDEACLYFENPNKLLELSEGARNHIVYMAKKTYEKLGEYFEKIYITSAYRTRIEQVNILKGKLDLNTDMYNYYKSASLSAPYLKIIQYLYDGKDSQGNEYLTVLDEEYLAIEQAYINRPGLEIDGTKRREDFKKIIDENSIRKGNKDDVEKVLNLSMVQQKLFTPSFHMGTDDINRKYSSSIDLRYSDTADTLRKEHIDSGNKGKWYAITPKEALQGKGDAHIHITYKSSS